MSDAGLRTTSLHPAHLMARAKMVPFAGYDMPVQYASVIAEAKAVREAAGMFDVSHMARFRVTGSGAFDFLQHVTTNDLAKLGDREGQYSLLPNEKGGVVDDIIVYRIHADEWVLVVNAANHQKDFDWLAKHITSGVHLADETTATAMIAVQGPKARDILAEVASNPDTIRQAELFSWNETLLFGIQTVAACSGYTGEDGFELIVAAESAVPLWQALEGTGVTPCGLASRDTLRVEAGLPLYGHELSDDISPIAAGLGWVVSKSKTFVGSEEIARARKEGTRRKLQGIRLPSKRLLTPGAGVFHEGQLVGEITSGVYSPVLETGIGFAFVDAAIPLGTAVEVEVRGARESALVVSKRFLKGQG